MMKKLLSLLVFAFTIPIVFAQAPGATCDPGVATPLTLVPGGVVNTGLQSTAGLGDNYGTTVSSDACVAGSGFYGDGNDGVYVINVVNGGDHRFGFVNSGNAWKVLTVHSACAPTGANCVGGFVTGANRDGNAIINLTPGTYYIVVDSWGAITTNASFSLSIRAPIANDDCSSADTVYSTVECSFNTYTTTDATDSGVADPLCGNYLGGDVWFEYEVNSTGSLTVEVDGVAAAFDPAMAIYTGTCGSLGLISCNDDISFANNNALISLTGRTPGETLYIRVWEYGNNNNGDFNLCVTTPVPSGDRGVTLTCPGDYALEMTSDAGCPPGVSASNMVSGNLDGAPTANRPPIIVSTDPCTFVAGTPRRYVEVDFTVNVTGVYVLEMIPNAGLDGMGYIVESPFTPGNCASGVYVAGDDDSEPIGNEPQITVTLNAGTNYTLVTTEYFAGTGDTPYTWVVLSGPDTNFNWSLSSPPLDWYAASSGGSPIGSGAGFNPVGVAGSGLADTNTPGIYSYWYACPSTPSMRTQIDYIIGKNWTGAIDNNWYNDSNWTPSGIPSLDDCVAIPAAGSVPNDPIVDQLNAAPLPLTTPAKGRTLTLLTNSYLEVATNTEIMVRESVNVQGTGILNLKSSASLIQLDDDAINTGDIYVQRSPNFDESAVAQSEYVYWSSPVQNFQVTDISPGSTRLYGWTPTALGNGAGNHGEWFDATGTMDDATGYIIRGLSGTPATIPATAYSIPNNTALFSGVPNNGMITKQIFHGNYNGAPYPGVGSTATNEDDNWNLIGNPYPSAISANAFVDANTNINGTVYLWDHTNSLSLVTADPFYEDFVYNYDGNDYFEHNNTGSNPPGTNDVFIGAGQGFFVFMNHAATSGSNVIFNNSMRYDNSIDDLIINYDNSNFYREDLEIADANAIERHRIWLDLLSPNNLTNSILVGYISNATNGFDRLYDGYDFSSDESGFYSISDDKHLSIQGRALPFTDEDIVPLGFIANETGNHTIAIHTLDGLFTDESQGIYLEDKVLNIIHDLRVSPYTFEASAGKDDDRFILRYTSEALSIDELSTTEISIIAPKGEYVKISANNAIENVTLYDIVGRPLFNKKEINSNQLTIINENLTSGTYIVEVTLLNGQKMNQKIILKN